MKDTSGKKKKKEEDETVNDAVEEVNNTKIENGTAEGKKKKEESASSKKKSESKKTEKVNKTVKKKWTRIIEPVDSSDDSNEDHLPVCHFKNFNTKNNKMIFLKLIFIQKVCFIISVCKFFLYLQMMVTVT